jgi:hypothetical protein
MKKIFSFLLISLGLYACYSPRYVYSPPTQNIPLLNKKNDFGFSAFYEGAANVFEKKGSYNRGFDLQPVWAVSNHFAVMLNENVSWEKNDGTDSFFPNDSSFLSYKRNFTEIGAGYFTSAGNNKKMKFQVFGGVAFGSSKIYDDFISNNIQADKYHFSRVTKVFVQPALIYSPFKNLSAALSSRFTEVLFTHIRTNYTSTELHNYVLDSIGVSPVFFWEPAVCYTFGFKKFPLKFQLQGSLTVLLNHRFVEHRSTNIGIGLIYNFPKTKENKPAASKTGVY